MIEVKEIRCHMVRRTAYCNSTCIQEGTVLIPEGIYHIPAVKGQAFFNGRLIPNVDKQTVLKFIGLIPGTGETERPVCKFKDTSFPFGAGISNQVLAQWIRRYGDPAREVIKKYRRLPVGES